MEHRIIETEIGMRKSGDYGFHSRLCFCIQCGEFFYEKNPVFICVPRISTDKGNTETNRALKAGEVKELKEILWLLARTEDRYGEMPGATTLIEAKSRIKQLILKREGLDRS